MQTKIINIGNSKGIRIPRVLLQETGLGADVELEVKKGELRVKPARQASGANSFGAASEKSFAKDWLRPEEDAAWAAYQPGK